MCSGCAASRRWSKTKTRPALHGNALPSHLQAPLAASAAKLHREAAHLGRRDGGMRWGGARESRSNSRKHGTPQAAVVGQTPTCSAPRLARRWAHLLAPHANGFACRQQRSRKPQHQRQVANSKLNVGLAWQGGCMGRGQTRAPRGSRRHGNSRQGLLMRRPGSERARGST